MLAYAHLSGGNPVAILAPNHGACLRAASAIFRTAARRPHRQIWRIEILALHLHDNPVQNAVADHRQARQLSRTVLEDA
jgi:hypothetical protein